jgi:hypothetical protein
LLKFGIGLFVVFLVLDQIEFSVLQHQFSLVQSFDRGRLLV